MWRAFVFLMILALGAGGGYLWQLQQINKSALASLTERSNNQLTAVDERVESLKSGIDSLAKQGQAAQSHQDETLESLRQQINIHHKRFFCGMM